MAVQHINGWAQFGSTAGVFTDLGGGVLNVSGTGAGHMFDGSLSSNGTSTWVDELGNPWTSSGNDSRLLLGDYSRAPSCFAGWA